MLNIKKKGVVLFAAGTICLSGLFGFGGAYLANSLGSETATVVNNSTPGSYQEVRYTRTGTPSGASLSVAEIAALTAGGVVEITTETVTKGGRMRQFVSEGAGSGIIITDDGYIVTNNHVIENASKITVRLSNGESYSAALIGRDRQTDIAVLKIETTDLPPVVFGNSDELVVGELTVAIGNPLGELGGTVTEGIISALNRDIDIDGETMNLLQTSAAINPGNSGGGLFNSRAELIGIVNAKSSGSGIEGLGFAIPINHVKEVIQQITAHGFVPGRIDLGITLIDIPDARTAMMYRVRETGVYVLETTVANGLETGDRIVSLDGRAVNSSAEVEEIIEAHQAGETLKVRVQRGTRTRDITLTLPQAKA